MQQSETQCVAIETESNPFGVQLEAPMPKDTKVNPMMKPFGGADLLQYAHKVGG